MHTSYISAIHMKEKSAVNVEHAYLSGIFCHKGGCITILNDNGTEFKNTVKKACDQLSIERLFSTLFHPQGNS